MCQRGVLYSYCTAGKAFYVADAACIYDGGQFAVIALWGYLANKLYRHVYPPRRVLLVYGSHPVEAFLNKMYDRSDCFVIGEQIKFADNLKTVEEKALNYDGVVICDLPSKQRNEILKFCYAHSIRSYITPKISDIIIGSAESMHYFDTPLLLARNDGLSIEQVVIKRLMDIGVSFLMLLVCSPIFLITAAAIKIYDRGPVFFLSGEMYEGRKNIFYLQVSEHDCECGAERNIRSGNGKGSSDYTGRADNTKASD